MSKQIQDAYIVAATRLPVAKRKGMFGHVRPDDMLAHAIKSVMAQAPGLDPALVDDVIVGCAMPEAEQGMNVARIGVLLAGLPNTVPGYTINRFCSSGVQAVADAAARIRLGEADVMIAAGTETMSLMNQMMGNKIAINPAIFENDDNYAIAFGMGLTAEKVAQQWKVSRDDQDAFAVASHQKACAAIQAGHFKAEISPYAVKAHVPDLKSGEVKVKEYLADTDEGPRPDSSLERLAKLKPVFAARGSVTAGNSSQMSDGAGAVLVVSEKILKQFNLKPLARFAGYSVAGVPPEVMGIGPIEAIPRVLKQAGVRQQDLDWIELNEAFAAQALAVMRTLELDPAKVNPLGATGAIRTATVVHGLQRTRQRYGMVTMCIGTGMGAAGLFEAIF
ncbi:MAG TPA: acetyl-CoA C-acyltransferase [Azospira sp.]|nr:acetyl-CoA C-acyltransferase [Azospira sp.]